jgi:hypothetical protein
MRRQYPQEETPGDQRNHDGRRKRRGYLALEPVLPELNRADVGVEQLVVDVAVGVGVEWGRRAWGLLAFGSLIAGQSRSRVVSFVLFSLAKKESFPPTPSLSPFGISMKGA